MTWTSSLYRPPDQICFFTIIKLSSFPPLTPYLFWIPVIPERSGRRRQTCWLGWRTRWSAWRKTLIPRNVCCWRNEIKQQKRTSTIHTSITHPSKHFETLQKSAVLLHLHVKLSRHTSNSPHDLVMLLLLNTAASSLSQTQKLDNFDDS